MASHLSKRFVINHSRPDPGRSGKLTKIFIFTFLCGASKRFFTKAFKAFIRRRQLNVLVLQAVGIMISGRSVCKIIFLSFRDDISENNADHRVKETCAIMSTQFEYEIHHVSLLQDSTTLSALNFCLLCILL